MTGGGAKGCFQVGVLRRIAQEESNGAAPEHALPWQYVEGVSTGALQAAGISGGTFEDLDNLENTWMSIRGNSDIYSKALWPLKVIFGDGIYNYESPWPWDKKKGLKKLIQKTFDPTKVRIPTSFGVVDELSGRYLSVSAADPMARSYLLASCAMAVYFPPVKVWLPSGERMHLHDGGHRHITPLKKFVEQGVTHLDIILASPIPMSFKKPDKVDKTYESAARALSMFTHQIYLADIRKLLEKNEIARGNPSSGLKYIETKIYAPHMSAILPDTLDFDPHKIREAYNYGLSHDTLVDHGYLFDMLDYYGI